MIQYVFQSSEDDSESSAEDGEETEILQQNGIPSPNKVPRMSNTDMSKDPSSTQVDELKETENIFQSSLLRLQVCLTFHSLLSNKKCWGGGGGGLVLFFYKLRNFSLE